MSADSQAFGVETTGEFEAVQETELVGEEPPRAASEPASCVSRAEERSDDSGEEPQRRSSIPPGEPGLRLLKRPSSSERPPSAALSARLEAAMAASARTEAALADLLRTAKFLSASIASVRSANAHLVRELEVLCALVDGDDRERAGLERRIQRLERGLEETRREATRERKFLVNEHDAFIATLVADHERELAELRERLSDFSSPPQAPDPTE